MHRIGLATFTAAALTAGTALWATSAAAGTTPRLCRTSDVSYYYGGFQEGLGQRSFDITLLAHDGVRCRLSDTPRITLAPPYGEDEHIPHRVGGRGGTLVLSPAAPLHTSISYYVADTPSDSTDVYSLTLHMPGGGTANPEPFGYPGTVQIATQLGVTITSWQTGLGLSEGYGPY